MKRGTPHHPKMYALAESLKLPLPCAVGILEMLWQFTADRRPQGDIGSLPDKEIAQACGWTKRPKLLIDALCAEKSRWLDRDEEHRLIVHDWPDHAEGWVCKKLIRSGKDFLPFYKKSANIRVRNPETSVANKTEYGKSDAPTREAKAMAKASDDFIKSEGPPPTREVSSLDLDDPAPVFVINSARRCGLRNRVKEPNRDMERLEPRWEQAERDYGRSEMRLGWLAFLDHVRSDLSIEHPQAYFLGSLARWISDSRPENGVSPPELMTPEVVSVSQELAPIDAMFEGYIGIFQAGGKPCGDKEREDALPLWGPLAMEQRENTCRDAYRICKDADPKFIPTPRNHLRQKPWTRLATPRILPSPLDDKEATRLADRAAMLERLRKLPIYQRTQ